MNIATEQEMYNFGHQFATSPDFSHIIELVGDVGAGKTTFTRGLAAGLGASTPVTSPSFTISKSYACEDGRILTHYDFYRLKDPGLMTEDLREKLADPRQFIVIEWGTSVANLLPTDHTIIHFAKNNDGSREITVRGAAQSAGPQQSAGTNSQNDNVSGASTEQLRAQHRRTRCDFDDCGPRTVADGNLAAPLRLYLDTSTSTTILKLNDITYEWHSGHELAEQLLQFIHDKLTENHYDWSDITEITFMSGPGSFTGLRIGAAVVNTLAHELHIPLKDHHGHPHQIILPDYGRPANITAPKK